MSIKLKVRQGGAAASQPDFANLADGPREGTPIFDDNGTPLVEIAQRWEQGTAGRGQYTYVDVHGTAPYRHRPHAEVKLIEDESGSDVIIGWGRHEGGNDTGRGIVVGGDEVEHTSIQVMDINMDLRGIPFKTTWSRPAENSWERLQALQAAKLNGSSSTEQPRRANTNVTIDTFGNGHLVDASDPVDLPAQDYPIGTEVDDVMRDIFEPWGRGWGVTIHHAGGSHKCLLVLEPDDQATFTSALRISDQLADWDPEDPTAPVLPPAWRRSNGKTADNSETISGLISIWGGTNDDPRSVYVETGEAPEDWETWVGVTNDDLSRTEAQATARANHFLNDRKRAYVTDQPSILLLPSQVGLITAGQSIEVKSVVLNQGPDKHDWVWKRIVEIAWEPSPDGRWWAHLSLERPRNTRARAGGGQPKSTSPKPPPVCEYEPEEVLADYDDDIWPGSWTNGNACWGGTFHRQMGASAGHSDGVPVDEGTTVSAIINFRNQTGQASWEDVDNYSYVASLRLFGDNKPTLIIPIVHQRYHAAGCIDVEHTASAVVPPGYTSADVSFRYRLGGIAYRAQIIAQASNDPDCIPEEEANPGGPYAPWPHTHPPADGGGDIDLSPPAITDCSQLSEGDMEAVAITNGDVESGATGWSGGAQTAAHFYEGTHGYLAVGTTADIAFQLPDAVAGVRYVIDAWRKSLSPVDHDTTTITLGVDGVDEESNVYVGGPGSDPTDLFEETATGADGGTWYRMRVCWTPSSDRTGVRLRIQSTAFASGNHVIDGVSYYTTENDPNAGTADCASRCDHSHVIESLPTNEKDTSKRLAPDGNGGTEWVEDTTTGVTDHQDLTGREDNGAHSQYAERGNGGGYLVEVISDAGAAVTIDLAYTHHEVVLTEACVITLPTIDAGGLQRVHTLALVGDFDVSLVSEDGTVVLLGVTSLDADGNELRRVVADTTNGVDWAAHYRDTAVGGGSASVIYVPLAVDDGSGGWHDVFTVDGKHVMIPVEAPA